MDMVCTVDKHNSRHKQSHSGCAIELYPSAVLDVVALLQRAALTMLATTIACIHVYCSVELALLWQQRANTPG